MNGGVFVVVQGRIVLSRHATHAEAEKAVADLASSVERGGEVPTVGWLWAPKVDDWNARRSFRDTPKMYTLHTIATAVAAHYRVPVTVLRGTHGSAVLHRARKVAWLLSRELTMKKLTEIAAFYDDRDHSFVSTAVSTTAEKAKTDAKLAGEIDLIRRAILGAPRP